MASPEIRPFRIDVPVEEVERLKRKLRDTRLPGRPIVPNAGSSFGMQQASRHIHTTAPLIH